MAATLLLATFQPVTGGGSNAANAAAYRLSEHWDAGSAGIEILPLRLPRAYARAANAVRAALAADRPDLFLLLDTDPASSDWKLHVFAANLDDSPEPDDDGIVLTDSIIDADGPVAYRSRLPLDGIWDKFTVERVPCRMSHKAGGHVFNHVFYQALRAVAEQALPTLCGAAETPPTADEAVAETEARSAEALDDDLRMVIAVLRKLHPAALKAAAQSPTEVDTDEPGDPSSLRGKRARSRDIRR